MSSGTRRPRVAILTHMMTPYRVPVVEHIARHFDVTVFYSGRESNRREWDGIESELKLARVKLSWGLTLKYWKRVAGARVGLGYFHLTPGYVADLLRWRPDAIISTEMGFRSLVALTYGTLLRRPVWVWWGGTLHTEETVGTARRWFRTLVARWAPGWISYGRTTTEYLLSLSIERRRILEIQNCVDERTFAARPAPAFDVGPKPVLLHAGQMIPRKGISQLLDAAKALQDEGHTFSLLLVGNGPDRPALEQQAKTLGLANVHFRAGVPAAQMPAVYQSADLYVFPTLRDAWGLVVNEALLSGLPVLGSRYAGCAPELLRPEAIFDPQNPEDFKSKLRLGLAGQLPPADVAQLRTSGEVGGMIVQELQRALRPHPDADLIPVDQ
jgi:glycosyltransferase involved in cell wall biosynthesis